MIINNAFLNKIVKNQSTSHWVNNNKSKHLKFTIQVIVNQLNRQKKITKDNYRQNGLAKILTYHR